MDASADPFSRVRLLMGARAVEAFARARVAVFGLGGVGGWCAEALVRSGVGNLMLVDDDRVAPSNLNRQLPALSSTVGRFKVDVLAERFHNPIVTFVDTPGAYPGREAEERGQAEAIAKSLEFFAAVKTPVVVVVTGEGGSGGALAIAVGDRVLMMENAVYSVISPEGCAGILWRDGAKAPEAAEALKITAADLMSLGAIDEIVKEPAGGAQKNPAAAIANVKKAVVAALKGLVKVPLDELVANRYKKLRAYNPPGKDS